MRFIQVPRETKTVIQNQAKVRHAIILAAGLGTRLYPLTERRPKPLVPVHGVPILHNALRCLAQAGVQQVTIIVGYRKEAIVRSCGHSFAGLEITYCESSVFDRTGSAYSLWLARDFLRQDTLVLEGDVFFEPDVLARLLSAEAADTAAVAPFDEKMTGSAVTLSDGGEVRAIRMNQTAADARAEPIFKTLNLFNFKAETLAAHLRPALDEMIGCGAVTSYFEQLLKHLIDARGLRLNAADCGDLRWMEIDSEADLRTAEAIFAPAGTRVQAPAIAV